MSEKHRPLLPVTTPEPDSRASSSAVMLLAVASVGVLFAIGSVVAFFVAWGISHTLAICVAIGAFILAAIFVAVFMAVAAANTVSGPPR